MSGWLALALLACASPADRACEDMCQQLVNECRYDAFPSLDSCLQGCAYAVDQGVDVQAEQSCLAEASCDTFEVVNCENRYGLSGEP